MLTVEKIEGKIITVDDDGNLFNADISDFDDNISEGDVIVRTSSGKYRRDCDATKKRRQEIIDLQSGLWN